MLKINNLLLLHCSITKWSFSCTRDGRIQDLRMTTEQGQGNMVRGTRSGEQGQENKVRRTRLWKVRATRSREQEDQWNIQDKGNRSGENSRSGEHGQGSIQDQGNKVRGT
jgi:hypothetical protein